MGASKKDESIISWVRGSLIGAGAFGKVNLAINCENGNLFAVKSIECNDMLNPELLALENEIRILKSINSPHVVHALGSSKTMEDGKCMLNLFLEYMPGGSLADLMKNFNGCQLGENLVRIYTKEILQGLHYLHTNGIVHCDVKAQNILMGSSGAKLADFGAASRVDYNDHKIESLMQIKGTPLWMAPEVVRQEEQGTSSDIWSLGCTIVQMVTGKAPWPKLWNSSPLAAMYHIGCSDEVPEMPDALSWEGKDFLQKCLCRNSTERWSSTQLLQHPFVRDMLQPLSPCSVLDNSCNSQPSSLPVSPAPLLSRKRGHDFLPEMNSTRIGLDSPVDQGTSCCSSYLWANSPLTPRAGKWIVVHAPKAIP